MGAQWSQFFPPKPTFTPADLEPQDGKVFIVTGGYSGIGFELSKMLYRKGGRVYIAGRSPEKAQKAIFEIRAATDVSCSGSLEFLHLELDDLSSIKASVEFFKAQESKLHILWNNAGVSQPPLGSVSKQGIELQLAVNCLGPFLFTQLLLPLMEATAAEPNTASSVRIVWTSSQIAELSSPPQGLIMDELLSPPKDKTRNYVNSKTGNLLLASELALRFGSHNIVSVATNPGAVHSNLFRHTPLLTYLAWPLLYQPKLAALTQLYAGISKDITLDVNGCYVIPWGRIAKGVKDGINKAMMPQRDGGTGIAKEFWDYCDEKTRDYS